MNREYEMTFAQLPPDPPAACLNDNLCPTRAFQFGGGKGLVGGVVDGGGGGGGDVDAEVEGLAAGDDDGGGGTGPPPPPEGEDIS